jgi:putative RecB family exonuclease
MTLEEKLDASIAMALAKKAEASTPEASRPFLMPPAPPPPGGIPEVLSPSSLNTFLDCAMRWYYSRVLLLPETRGSALGLGTAVHTALLGNLAQKIETKLDLPEEGVRATFIEALTQELDTMVLAEDEDVDELKASGEAMVRIFMDRIAPTIEPAAVELPVEGVIGGVPVRGFVDIRAVDGTVIDLKTAKRKPAGITPAHLVQVATYSMLDPLASNDVRIVTLTKTRTVDASSSSATLLPGDKRYVESLYSIARDQMGAGVYAPNRSSFLCSRRHCSFWRRCLDEFGGKVGE